MFEVEEGKVFLCREKGKIFAKNIDKLQIETQKLDGSIYALNIVHKRLEDRLVEIELQYGENEYGTEKEQQLTTEVYSLLYNKEKETLSAFQKLINKIIIDTSLQIATNTGQIRAYEDILSLLQAEVEKNRYTVLRIQNLALTGAVTGDPNDTPQPTLKEQRLAEEYKEFLDKQKKEEILVEAEKTDVTQDQAAV